MKRTLLFLLVTCWSVIMMAGNVTPEEALQQATKFMKERVAKGVRRAPAAASSLTMAKDVCGLYVFNVGQSDGFVIVSPDDRTDAILGYSDNGTLDSDNMPENMRAWLQGYADEIKWLNEHNYQPVAKARRVSPVKPAIDPLVTSHWNQDAPYNNQVKTYAPDGGSGVTGCVATAMAQVMYYTAKQAGLTTSTPTKDIPGYTVGSSNKDIPGVSASEVIRWDLMRDTYNAGDTDEGADAVAALMRICGAALEMEYKDGVSSGQGEDIPPLLKTYFGYAETVMTADRSYYSYVNWIEMVYNELKQGRAVVYGGQSTSSGHEFVCDGYQGEDYFHINWGWGGMSDGYFQLSVMNSDEQGIGGSSSGDGYSTGQHAVIGIQLEGGTGTVLSNPNIPDLTLNSVTADKTTMTIGETAHVIFNVTNNSSDDYDGELGFYFISYGLGDGKMFLIPAGGTKDCVMDFHPTSAGTYWITAYKTNGQGKFIGLSYDKYVEIEVIDGGAGNPTSDEIAITSSLAVENSEPNMFYGTTFKATLTITNPETGTDYSGWYEYALQEYGGSWSLVDYTSARTTVPANCSINIPVEFTGLVTGKSYRFIVTRYVEGTGWTGWAIVGDAYYTCSPAIMSYAADGTATVTKTSNTSYAVPSGAVAVDLSDAGVTTVTKNSNPNCLYILKKTDAVPAGVTNVITTDGSSYTAKDITLTDGYDFYTPVDFTASNIEFTYNCDRWADGTNGWNTIMLPFDVTSVTADDTPIGWFHSGSDTGKQFWLKAFTGDDTVDPKVYFDYVSGTMQANTPYIIALPGNHWGTENDLSGKTIKFIGSGEIKKSAPAVVTASNYRFVGDTKAVNTKNIYCINAAGDKFELKATGGSAAFRPFFKPEIFDRSVESLSIGGGDGPTAIQNIKVGTDSNVYFDLNGRRVLNPTKGVYIKNGNKVVIK